MPIPGRGGSCRPLTARQHPLAAVDSPRAMAICGPVLSCEVAGVGRAGLKDVWVISSCSSALALGLGGQKVGAWGLGSSSM